MDTDIRETMRPKVRGKILSLNWNYKPSLPELFPSCISGNGHRGRLFYFSKKEWLDEEGKAISVQ